jgi:hypothetical protein
MLSYEVYYGSPTLMTVDCSESALDAGRSIADPDDTGSIEIAYYRPKKNLIETPAHTPIEWNEETNLEDLMEQGFVIRMTGLGGKAYVYAYTGE